jgi:MSHA biogenesis protein MshJ
MSPRLEQLRARIDEFSLRERALLFLSLLAVLLTAWQSLLMDPAEAEQKKLLERIGILQREVEMLDNQTQDLLAARTADPDDANRRAEKELRAALAELDTRIQGTVEGLVEPKQMAQMLEDVLTRNPGLKLKAVRSLAAAPLVAAEQGMSGTVYQHGLRLELQGSYLDTITYLRALQKLPRAIYWDEVRVVMDKYPTARITITVHTLSLSEGWIGV